MPSRRRFLLSTALAAGLAGCTGGDSSQPGATETDSTTATTTEETPETTATRTTTETTETTETPQTIEPREETPESEVVQWRVAFDTPLSYRPTVADGRVFVPVGDPKYGTGEPTPGALAGLDAANGTPQWTTELPAAPTGRPRADASGVACTSGGADGLGLHGRNQQCVGFAPDGTEEWRSKTVDQFLHLLALDDDRAYLATSDDVLDVTGQSLFAVGREEGRTEWSVETGDARDGRLVDGSLLVAPGGRAVARRDAQTGKRRWQRTETEALGSADSPFTISDGALFVSISSVEGDGRFAAIELSDGSQRWSYAKGGGKSFVPTGATVAADTVIGTEYGGRAFGLSVVDGTERWTFDATGKTREPPIVVGGTVYLRAYHNDVDDVIHALDAETGTEQWQTTVPGFATSLLPTDEMVVVASGNAGGSVRALDPDDGSERWRFSAIEKLWPVVTAEGGVLVASERGIVRRLG